MDFIEIYQSLIDLSVCWTDSQSVSWMKTKNEPFEAVSVSKTLSYYSKTLIKPSKMEKQYINIPFIKVFGI